MNTMKIKFSVCVILTIFVENWTLADSHTKRSNMGEIDQQGENFTSNIEQPADLCYFDCYDVETELHIVREWYDLVSTPIDKETDLLLLERESCHNTEVNMTMCPAFRGAMEANKSVENLTIAECTAVTMYTYLHPTFGSFNKHYANDMILWKWKTHRVFTTLLQSAIKKLTVQDPISANAKLYVIKEEECGLPKWPKFFCKTFAFGILNPSEDVLEDHMGLTWLQFDLQIPILVARITSLSLNLEEYDEALVSPFVAFEFNGEEHFSQHHYRFSVSENQELLDTKGQIAIRNEVAGHEVSNRASDWRYRSDAAIVPSVITIVLCRITVQLNSY